MSWPCRLATDLLSWGLGKGLNVVSQGEASLASSNSLVGEGKAECVGMESIHTHPLKRCKISVSLDIFISLLTLLEYLNRLRGIPMVTRSGWDW